MSTTAPEVGARSRLPSLTGMRFFAAAVVFVYHVSRQYVFRDQAVNNGFLDVMGRTGGIGVSFFFVLSGFVLTWSARRDEPPRLFWRRRACKIYPNHVVMWAVTIVLMLSTGGVVTVAAAIPNLLLVQSWSPNSDIFFSVNQLAWSLSCEVFFYFLFPFLLRGLLRLDPRRLWPCAIALMAAIWCVPFLANLLPQQPAWPEPGNDSVAVWSLWATYIFPPTRLLEFLLGMLLALIVRNGRWIGLRLGPAAGLALLGYLLGMVVPYVWSLVAATVIPLALLVPAAAVADLRGQRSPLRNRVMTYLGEVSFALYLVGGQVTGYLLLAFGKGPVWSVPGGTAFIVVCLLAAVLAAGLLHRYVEQPFMTRFARPRPRPVREIAEESTSR
ncbi:acyltransferase family protein [Kutzneria albida]|uniref:Acyltransferase n=1 Tax=Kutzneria albida DSM 43870 TaxID=1449976 RepID=W5WGC9_9PSEU|nr:acyltransferase [Kutzneria albida]AHH97214.1 acyltransferase [Kutzneria albida DSM 43870]